MCGCVCMCLLCEFECQFEYERMYNTDTFIWQRQMFSAVKRLSYQLFAKIHMVQLTLM